MLEVKDVKLTRNHSDDTVEDIWKGLSGITTELMSFPIGDGFVYVRPGNSTGTGTDRTWNYFFDYWTTTDETLTYRSRVTLSLRDVDDTIMKAQFDQNSSRLTSYETALQPFGDKVYFFDLGNSPSTDVQLIEFSVSGTTLSATRHTIITGVNVGTTYGMDIQGASWVNNTFSHQTLFAADGTLFMAMQGWDTVTNANYKTLVLKLNMAGTPSIDAAYEWVSPDGAPGEAYWQCASLISQVGSDLFFVGYGVNDGTWVSTVSTVKWTIGSNQPVVVAGTAIDIPSDANYTFSITALHEGDRAILFYVDDPMGTGTISAITKVTFTASDVSIESVPLGYTSNWNTYPFRAPTFPVPTSQGVITTANIELDYGGWSAAEAANLIQLSGTNIVSSLAPGQPYGTDPSGGTSRRIAVVDSEYLVFSNYEYLDTPPVGSADNGHTLYLIKYGRPAPPPLRMAVRSG